MRTPGNPCESKKIRKNEREQLVKIRKISKESVKIRENPKMIRENSAGSERIRKEPNKFRKNLRKLEKIQEN